MNENMDWNEYDGQYVDHQRFYEFCREVDQYIENVKTQEDQNAYLNGIVDELISKYQNDFSQNYIRSYVYESFNNSKN